MEVMALESENSYEKNDRKDLESLQPTAELCAYYRTRISEFDKERNDMLDRLSHCEVNRDEFHRTQWELKKRVEEVKDLQKALSDSHTYLFDERQRLLDMQAENDELKLQEMEDRKRIQHLLALTEPVEQEITYSRNGKTNSLHLLPRTCSGKATASTCTVARPEPPHMHQPVQACERIMRTVYLPTSNVESLLLKCESLQSQLNEQKRYSNERIGALLEDRRIRESDDQAYRQTMERRLGEQTKKVEHTEALLAQTTRDYVVARSQAKDGQQIKMEKTEECKRMDIAINNERHELAAKHREELEKLKAEMTRQQNAALASLRSQLKRREEELCGLGGVHQAVLLQYQARIRELEASLEERSQKLKKLEARRLLDIQGFNIDVTNLRKQIAFVERKLHQMRLACRLEDDERLDNLLDMLETRVPSQDCSYEVGFGHSEDEVARVGIPLKCVTHKLNSKRGPGKGRQEGTKPRPRSAKPAKHTPAQARHEFRGQASNLSLDLGKVREAICTLDSRVGKIPNAESPKAS